MLRDIPQIIDTYHRQFIECEKSYKFKYFIDTADLINMTIGYHFYYTPVSYNLNRLITANKKFKSDEYILPRSLTYSLFMGGYLGQLNLLPMHQGEFFDMLNKNLGVLKDELLTEKKQSEFMKDIESIDGQKKDVFIRYKTLSTKEDCRVFFQTTKDNCIDYFKLIYILYNGDWRNRLRHLDENQIILINNYDLEEVITLVSSNEFKKLKEAIDNDIVRAKDCGKSNNFNDALSLTYLLYLNKKATEEIPVLLDSTGLFQRVIKSAGLESEFTYLNKNQNIVIPIVRDPGYFIMKAIFTPLPSKLEKIKREMPKYYSEEAKTNEVVEIGKNILESTLNEYDYPGLSSQVEKIIKENENEFADYVNHKFFINVWLPSFADEDIYVLITKKIEGQNKENLINSEVGNLFVQRFVDRYKKLIEEKEYFDIIAKTLNYLLNEMRSSNKVSRAKRKKNRLFADLENYNTDRPLFANVYYGIFRFSMPYEVTQKENSIYAFESKLKEILSDEGLLSNNEMIIYGAFTRISEYLTEGLFKENTNSLTIALSVLWTLNRKALIDQILKKFEARGEYPHYSYALLHCAAIADYGSDPKNKERVINIKNCVSKKTEMYTTKFNIGICICYILYLLWDRTYTSTFSKSKTHPPVIGDPMLKESLNLINDALCYLRDIIQVNVKLKDPMEEIFYLYALNMKIYIIVECCPNENDFFAIADDVNTFKSLRISWKTNWQSRFDDTIARYYLRKAIYDLQHSRKRDFKQGLVRSREFIEAAIKDSPLSELDRKKDFEEILQEFDNAKVTVLQKKYPKCT